LTRSAAGGNRATGEAPASAVIGRMRVSVPRLSCRWAIVIAVLALGLVGCSQLAQGRGNLASPLASTSPPQPPSATRLDSEPTLDPFPYDTDNDGIDNAADPDDDSDGILDTSDDCRLVRNTDQLDDDGDGAGDACDFDADGDGVPNSLEQLVGADPLDAASVPEYVGAGNACDNRVDDDRDGGIDGADPGCKDDDGDGIADRDDNCPTVSNRSQRDTDGDGLGDACDLVVHVDWVRFASLPATNSGTEFYWSATRAGTFSVRSGGIDCTTGSVIDSGAYDPGTYDPARGGAPYSALAIVPPTVLAVGENVLRVCVAAGSMTASATTRITVGTDATPSSS
jgi:hypothetical protein